MTSTDDDDFDDDTYTVVFAEGATPFPLTECVGIDTDEDSFLEGDHDFTVVIMDTAPNDAVVIAEPSSHVVTINDNDGM